jgi:hypothetical protein
VRISLERVAHVFLALTAIVVMLTVLHVWELLVLSSATLARIAVTYLLVTALLSVTAAVGHWQRGRAAQPRRGSARRLNRRAGGLRARIPGDLVAREVALGIPSRRRSRRPQRFSAFINSHAKKGWRVVTMERERRRAAVLVAQAF